MKTKSLKQLHKADLLMKCINFYSDHLPLSKAILSKYVTWPLKTWPHKLRRYCFNSILLLHMTMLYAFGLLWGSYLAILMTSSWLCTQISHLVELRDYIGFQGSNSSQLSASSIAAVLYLPPGHVTLEVPEDSRRFQFFRQRGYISSRCKPLREDFSYFLED